MRASSCSGTSRRSGWRIGVVAVAALAVVAPLTVACTRAVYFGKEGQTVTGRSMDWMEDVYSDLWVFPRGMARDGGVGAGSLQWTSRYGSVVTCAYKAVSVDGMNEKGLVANLLYLAESEYPPDTDPRPGVSIGGWAQYALDRFATVSPPFDEQLALNRYWEQVGGTVMLPGTNRAADRFVRALFYINACRQSADPREAVAAVFSVIRNASVPRGISTPAQPNIASTIWRTVSDQKNRVYYFEDTARPSLVWVKLDRIDFQPGSGVRKVTLTGKEDVAGDQTTRFEKAAPYKFLAPKRK